MTSTAGIATPETSLVRLFLERVPERTAILVEAFWCREDSVLLRTAGGILRDATRQGLVDIARLAGGLIDALDRDTERAQIADRLENLVSALRRLRIT